MVLHNDLLQTRAKILHLLILTAVLASILNLTKRSTDVIPFFCDEFWKHISHTQNHTKFEKLICFQTLFTIIVNDS